MRFTNQAATPQTEKLRNESLLDPITVEIIAGALRSTMSEMEALIERTAMSPFIREKKDFNTAVYTASGELVCLGGLGVTANVIKALFKAYPAEEMQEGDIYWYNDCYFSEGAVSHTPDQVFAMPVFFAGSLLCFIQSWAHFNDIGGLHPGTLSPDCTDIHHEGVIVPPVRLENQGVINEDMLRLFARNSRFPEMVRGDTRALSAAVKLGRQRLTEIAERFSAKQFAATMDHLIERTSAEVQRRARAILPNGEYSATEKLGSDGFSGPFDIAVDLSVTENSIIFDTSRSSNQTKGPFNYLMSQDTPALLLSSFLLAGDNRYMINAGTSAALSEARFREGSIVRPKWPGALGSRSVTHMRITYALMAIMAQATNGQVSAAGNTYVICYLRGEDENGELFLLTDPLGVGYGGSPSRDGNDAIYLVANENYPAEFVESAYPIRVQRYAIATDTGGPGQWRGGCGVIRELEVMAPLATLGIRLDGIDFPPWGVNGGKNAGRGICVVNPGRDDERIIDPVSDGTVVKRGDIVRIITGGGGGWGHPYDRPVEKVLADVEDGFVSIELAAEDYGVIVKGNDASSSECSLDEEATKQRRNDRPAVKMFYRDQYLERL
jgi:N-methylhydantoinase B